jgi:hypothetical protein
MSMYLNSFVLRLYRPFLQKQMEVTNCIHQKKNEYRVFIRVFSLSLFFVSLLFLNPLLRIRLLESKRKMIHIKYRNDDWLSTKKQANRILLHVIVLYALKKENKIHFLFISDGKIIMISSKSSILLICFCQNESNTSVSIVKLYSSFYIDNKKKHKKQLLRESELCRDRNLESIQSTSRTFLTMETFIQC